MKAIQNSLFIVFVISVFSALSSSDVTTSAGITNSIVYANTTQAIPLLLAKKDDEIIIYKKDIIIRPDELKSEPKKNTEEFKTVNKPETKRQETIGLDIIDKYLKEGKKYEARNALSDIFISKKIPEKQKEIKEQLDRLNEELVFSSSSSQDDVIYTVQPGDVLARIAKQFNTNYELIMRINGKATTRLNVGEKLKILTGKTKILVNKTDFTLTLLLNDHYVKQYRIGTGKNDKTPVGTFEVKNKMKEPTWYSPNGGIFPYGHQENILGTRWIGFKDKPDVIGYGIHGTTLPETIGTALSNGCVRMINSDVEELYDFVTLDTKIIIQK